MRHKRGLAVLAMVPTAWLMVGVGSTQTAGAATQTTVYSQNGRNSCPDGGATTGEGVRPSGFAVLNDSQPSEGLTVQVSLQNALPTHTYTVHVIECNGTHDLGPSTVGTFQTGADGSGTFFGDHVEKGAADHAFVGIIDDPHASVFATVAVQI